MTYPLKRAAAIHDLSGFGRCSLTCIIPVLSAMSIQCVPIPTAVLSTHTGGFTDFEITDMTGHMRASLSHYKRLGLTFDAIYSGFLGSGEQVGIVEDYISAFRGENTVALCDPVMGDDGAAYQTVTGEHRESMKTLCAMADVITPNVTEAFFLLDRPYAAADEDAAAEMLYELAEKYCKKVVITGIHGAAIDKPPECAVADADGSEKNQNAGEEFVTTASLDMTLSGARPVFCRKPAIKRGYPGTGDIFASVLLGRLLKGKSLAAASEDASSFVWDAMSVTARTPSLSREGVMLESVLYELIPR
ncbi:MAG: pyridoxamine kinase [Eubacteriales bacterium]